MNSAASSHSSIAELDTPAALIDVARMERNINRMQAKADALGVLFRSHVKTTKCVRVFDAQRQAGARGITVSNLKEADHFFVHGEKDILHAVGMAEHRLEGPSPWVVVPLVAGIAPKLIQLGARCPSRCSFC